MFCSGFFPGGHFPTGHFPNGEAVVTVTVGRRDADAVEFIGQWRVPKQWVTVREVAIGSAIAPRIVLVLREKKGVREEICIPVAATDYEHFSSHYHPVDFIIPASSVGTESVSGEQAFGIFARSDGSVGVCYTPPVEWAVGEIGEPPHIEQSESVALCVAGVGASHSFERAKIALATHDHASDQFTQLTEYRLTFDRFGVYLNEEALAHILSDIATKEIEQ